MTNATEPIESNKMPSAHYRRLNLYMWYRTLSHIKRVQHNGLLLMKYIPELHTREFKMILVKHDLTKLHSVNEKGYTLLTDQITNGTRYSPEDIQEIKEAWHNHHSEERHHPEYWLVKHKTLSKMTEVYLAEMVCDWHAMTQELKQTSTTQWYEDMTIGNQCQRAKYIFDTIQTLFIEKCIGVLERYAPVDI